VLSWFCGSAAGTSLNRAFTNIPTPTLSVNPLFLFFGEKF
jgi:hypothetical protein